MSCDAVTHRYGRRTALAGVTWLAEQGVTGVLGRNGAGKTTLLRIITTLLRPTSGEVTISGVDALRNAEEVRKVLGYLPQDFQPYAELTVVEYLDYVAYMAKLPRPQIRGEIERVLGLANLERWSGHVAGSLSGGTRRRLGLAQALLGAPRLLVIDEPTAGLDVEERVHLRGVLAELGRDCTVVVSTHLTDDLEAIAGRLVVIDRGRVLFDDSPALLRSRAEGRVFEVESSVPTAPADQPPGTVVVRAVPTATGFRLRVTHPTVQASAAGSAVTATLEDGYLLLLADGAA